MAKLYFKYGSMGSSKTAQALITKYNYEENGMHVWLIKPAADERDGAIILRSRVGLEAPAEVVPPHSDIYELYRSREKTDVIIVDECQFLTPAQIDQLRDIVDVENIPVLCFGLRTDFQCKLFDGSRRLFEVADTITEIKAICDCGAKATVNARLDSEGCIVNATPDDFGQTVLMPGDPLRSKYIAEHFLENARLVNNVRGVQGYTGTYHGVKVSVMASGMGIPSIGIYSYELYNAFGVQNIMRIGSAGSINPDIHVRDIVIAQGACTDSNFLHQYHIDGTFAPIASYEMLRRAVASCEQVGATYHVGNVLSTDNFYNDDEGMPEVLQTVPAWIKMGVMACEMEAAGLYMTAARWKKNALCICTISDHMLTGEALPAEERQTSFTQMMEVALETAVKLEK